MTLKFSRVAELDKRPVKRERLERSERHYRTPDIEGVHYFLPHKIHDDGRITCVCREVDKLRVH